MKLYKESMRRLGLVGVAFLVVSVVLTAILCASEANGALTGSRLDSVFDLLPTLTGFAYAGGLAFAYVGFSFLNKRSDSDFYHSLPVKRADLYIANTMAALTWTVATVVLSTLTSLIVYLFFSAPFVPAYYPLGALFFIAATLLVYAAAAIAMSVTGTIFTNIVMTGIVLFLPRFILFMIGRTIVAGVNIVGWWDLPSLLNPRTNAATGMIVMTRRIFLATDFVTLPNALYSLALAAVEIVLGGILFVKRPSELAERGARNSKLQTLFACLLTLPVLLILLRYIIGIRKLTIAILIVASLAIFVIYQLIALRSVKRVAKTLPWYLCTVALALGLFFGMRAVNTAVLNTTPAASEIKSVQFGVPEPEWGYPGYNDLLVADIVFEDEAVKDCVAGSLGNAVERLRQFAATGERYYDNRTFEPGVANSIIPIKITLNNGRVIRRTIEFTNMNDLNRARNQNDEYMAAIRAFPAPQEVSYTTAQTYSEAMAQGDALKVKEAYFAEKSEQGAVYGTFEVLPVRPREMRYYPVGDEQSYGNLYVAGYHGTHRYSQYYTIQLDTPKTASLWMQLNNQLFGADGVRRAEEKLAEVRAKTEDDSQININLVMTNVPMQDGTKQQINMNYYTYFHNGEEQRTRDASRDYIDDMLALLRRGTLTSDPHAFNVAVSGSAYYRYNHRYEEGPQNNFGTFFIGLTPEDEAALLKLMTAWNEAQAELERVYDPDYALPAIEAVAE